MTVRAEFDDCHTPNELDAIIEELRGRGDPRIEGVLPDTLMKNFD